MKMEKNKHDHKPTKILKILTFGIFLLLPFWAIATATAYSTFNASATNEVTHNTLETPTTLQHGEKYTITINERININSNWLIYYSNYENVETNTTKSTTELNRLQIAGTDAYYYASFNTDLYNYFIGSFDFTFDYGSNYEELLPLIKWHHTYTEEIDQRNTFYYAVNQIEEQPLFAWTKETATYNTFKLLTNGFENNNNFIPVTLTYMFMVTCIYLIIDIVIESATWATHIIAGNKN